MTDHDDHSEFRRAIRCWFDGDGGEFRDSWLVPEIPLLRLVRVSSCELEESDRKHLEALVAHVGNDAEQRDSARRICTLLGFSLPHGPEESCPEVEWFRQVVRGLVLATGAACGIESAKLLDAIVALGSAYAVDCREVELEPPIHRESPDPVDAFLYGIAESERRKVRVSGWLAAERLLNYLLKSHDEPVASGIAAQILLYGETHNEGVVMPVDVVVHPASVSGVYVDPLACGAMMLDAEMISCVYNAARISEQSLCTRTQLARRPIAIRLAPRLPEAWRTMPPSLTGRSGGLLLACAVLAAAEGKPWVPRAATTACLRLPETQSQGTLWGYELTCEAVADRSVEKKLGAARAAGISTVLMTREQAARWKDDPAAAGIQVMGVSSFNEAYRVLTANARFEEIIRLYAESVAATWRRFETATDEAALDQVHRIDRYVDPSFSLLDEGRTPFDSSTLDEMLARPDDKRDDGYHPISDTGPDVLQSLLTAHHWLCVTEDAGSGKSVFAWKAQAWFSSPEGYVHFPDGRPAIVVRWEGRWPADERGVPLSLIDALAQSVREVVPNLVREGQRDEAREVVEYALAEKRVVVIIDALDQFSSAHRQHLDQVLGSLDSRERELLAANRLMLTSRAYAVRQNLFGKGSWRYARIDGFTTEAQQDRYLADLPSWKKMIPDRAAVAELLRSPIVLRVIRDILEALPAETEPPTFHNRGDLYWEASKRLLRRAIEKEQVAYAPTWATEDDLLRDLRRVLATIAFHLLADDENRFASEQLLYAVMDSNIRPFLDVCKRNFVESAAAYEQPLEFQRWTAALAILERIEFSNRATLEAINADCLSFRSLKTMEFYAGLYLGAHADQRTWDIARRLTNHDRWSWAWRFAIELPRAARHDETLCRSLALLYERPPQGRRPTELMYRAWHLIDPDGDPLLLRQLGYADPDGLPLAGSALRSVARQVSLRAAREVIDRFRSELWERIRAGDSTALTLVPEEILVREGLLTEAAAKKRTGKQRTYCRCPQGEHTPVEPFTMGSPDREGGSDEHPCHPVQVRAPFWMMATPVTRAQYALFDEHFEANTPKDTSREATFRGYASDPACPVILSTWYDAFCFSKWVGGGLPTEAEWEYACRAGTTTAYSFGPSLNGTEANCDGKYPYPGGTKKGPSLGRTSPVRSYAANKWGLFDMHGNVLEWCWDWYHSEWYSQRCNQDAGQAAPDEGGPIGGSSRVLRGGSWYYYADYCRSAYRYGNHPPYRNNLIGFRVSWGISPESS